VIRDNIRSMNNIEEIQKRIESKGAAFVDSMITDQEAYYDVRADVYEEQNEIPVRRNRREAMYKIYHAILPSLLPSQITYMDFGCGTGSTTADFIAGMYDYAEVAQGYAVDISPKMIELARQNLPSFTTEQGGPYKLDSENKFDLITAFFHVVCHLTDTELGLFFQNAHKCLKPNGVVCFEVVKQLKVGERGYTQADKEQNRRFWAYPSEKKDGTKVRDKNGQLVVGTDRMFERDEIINFAMSNGLGVVEIKEALVTDPDDTTSSNKELVVVLKKL
jgi:SAM-dependent methyltransferase